MANDLEKIIHDWLEDQFIENFVDKSTGEIQAGARETWNTEKPYFEREARAKLNAYEKHCTKTRLKHNMNPFNWDMETEDRIRDQLKQNNKLPRFRNPEGFLFWDKPEEPWPGFPKCEPKPEFQGKKHPLEQNQVQRTAKTVNKSKRATKALENYEKTGILTVPEQDRLAWEQDKIQWDADMPICTKPIQKIEGLDAVFADVQQKLKKRLDEIDRGEWTPITGPKTHENSP